MDNPDKETHWFLRLPTDILKSDYIMSNATAADWRVLISIAKHQGYQTRRTFPLSIAKTTEEARCDRRTVFRSIGWWCKVGALLKTKRRRVNVYEIPRHFTAPPGIGDSLRHNTRRQPKRDGQGRFVPSRVTRKVTPHGTIEVTAHGTPNQKSLSEVFIENPPPPPTGGNGHASETSARPLPPSPLSISEATIKELMKVKGREGVLELLKKGNYPIPEFLLSDEKSA